MTWAGRLRVIARSAQTLPNSHLESCQPRALKNEAGLEGHLYVGVGVIARFVMPENSLGTEKEESTSQPCDLEEEKK